MILLLGSTGYIGKEFAKQLKEKNIPFISLPHNEVNYQNLWLMANTHKDNFKIINAAGYTGKPNVDYCETHKEETIAGNITFVNDLINFCIIFNIPFGHVSSGCIYSGKKDNMRPFTELDEPNFTFTQNNCSFYSGTKAIGEKIVNNHKLSYNWRLRIPFDNINNPRNYISKLLNYDYLLDVENSISDKEEFVTACIDCLMNNYPFGIYNIVNSGAITTRQVVEMIKQTIGKDKNFNFFKDIYEFYAQTKATPRSNCVLDNSKILNCGAKISNTEDILLKRLETWQY